MLFDGMNVPTDLSNQTFYKYFYCQTLVIQDIVMFYLCLKLEPYLDEKGPNGPELPL